MEEGVRITDEEATAAVESRRGNGGGGGLVAQSCLTLATLWTVACQAPLLWNSPGKNAGVDCYSLLQGIFPTQGSNPGVLHCRQILYSQPPGKPSQTLAAIKITEKTR